MPFGVRLRQLRTDRGMSLSELARRTYFSKGYLSKVENGARAPGAEFARQCDAALDAGGELVALQLPHATAHPLADDPRRDEAGRDWVLRMDGQGSVWFQPVDRRQVLATGAASLLALSGGPRAGPHGAETVATFTSMFGQLRRLGQLVTPDVILPTLIVQTQTLRALAADSSGRTRRDLCVLASRYAEYTGWMAQESGQEKAALWWTDTSVELAAAGGDDELSAYSLVRRALITLYAGDAAQTVTLARRAQAHPAAGERVRGLAAQREAQGHALLGDRGECLRALDRAERLLDVAAADAGPVLGSTTVANPVRLSRAWCLHDLGRPGEAAPLFERELAAVPADARRFRARWSARHVLALASGGELDHACALVPGLLADCGLVDSATIRSDLAALARVLSRRLSYEPVQRAYVSVTGFLHPRLAWVPDGGQRPRP